MTEAEFNMYVPTIMADLLEKSILKIHDNKYISEREGIKEHYIRFERYKEEVSKYGRGLQYRPSNPQLEIIAKNCPVYIDGEGVGEEVSGQRDLP